MNATRRHLIGRTIVDVDMRPFRARPDGTGQVCHDPVLKLDNGRRVWFVAEETETGEYGVGICITNKLRRRV